MKFQDTDVEEFLLFPVNRLLVCEPLCFLPELGDGRLVTKILPDLWPFCKLNAARESTWVTIWGTQRWAYLKVKKEMLGSGELEPIVHYRVLREGVETVVRSLDLVEEDPIVLIL